MEDVCHALLARADVDVNLKTRKGATALHVAAEASFTSVCLSLLARKDFTEVNAQDAHGWTCLHFAAGNGLVEVCEAILDREDFTEVRAETDYGATAHVFATQRGIDGVRAKIQRAGAVSRRKQTRRRRLAQK